MAAINRVAGGRSAPSPAGAGTRGKAVDISPSDPAGHAFDSLTRSLNPLVLVAAAREALRLSRADGEQIARFSDEAMGAMPDAEAVREVVCRWINRHDLGPGELLIP
jgi:hypothetical protein